MSARSGHYNSRLNETLTEGRVELLEVLTIFINAGLFTGLCYICYLGLKLITTIIICRHPELTDEKVKYITKMISKDKHQSN